MLIIPAIDIINGQCVRLSQGDYNRKTVYEKDPLIVAQRFEAAGLKRLHLVDLDGAKAKRIINHKVLERIATHTKLHIDFGGGLKSDEDVHIAFESGAKQITGGTIAVKSPETFLKWLADYGAEKIILGADVRNSKVAISGWKEESEWTLMAFLKFYQQKGIRHVICTDISKDGLLEGTSRALYQYIRVQLPDLQLIASGGVKDRDDLEALQVMGCAGVIIGKAIYEGYITLEDLQAFI
ncbi:MAG: 1-(5-phosphoribosyl)-5-[(5-phosphoribosylamino)methylideneamino]imidazole-4-carboxamide isomerase [Bacteroidota bacterium]